MAKAVKLADIAGRLGVSNVTVSKALSGQKGVSEEMRKKSFGWRMNWATGSPRPGAGKPTAEAAASAC